LLPIVVHRVGDYEPHLEGAREALEARDPDDAHPLALSRALGLPLWSSDLDLERRGVDCYSTAALLKLLTG
jgi:hypothetical protein